MKLSDIDEMVRVKAAYLEAKALVAGAASNRGEGEISLFNPHTRIPWHIVREAVIPVVQAALKKHHDELVSKLMLYGVEDWNK